MQGELGSIRKWRDNVASLRKDLTANAQADLYSRVRKELDVSTLRDSLNKVRLVGDCVVLCCIVGPMRLAGRLCVSWWWWCVVVGGERGSCVWSVNLFGC